MGLCRAGWSPRGVDIEQQDRYPFDFTRADALDVTIDPRRYGLVWASPPCQAYSMYSRNTGTAGRHPDLVARVREKLSASGVPYVIENVLGAPIRADVLLCGTMFGLGVRRHRIFELSFPAPALTLACNHARDAIPVFGHGTPQWHRRKWGRNISIVEKRAAMGIDWMNRDELSEAIPPAFGEWIGRLALESLR